MRDFIKLVVVIAVAPIALAACENPMVPKQTLSPAFGDAVRHNMAVQIINPDGHPDLTPPPMDGARDALAIERYRKGETKAVEMLTTTDVGTQAK